MIKIGFFGTPGIAAYNLQKLAERYDIAFVVSGDDKPAGRHLKTQCCPAKYFALEKNFKVLHPVRLRDEPFLDELRKANADIFVVVAYGRIIPPEVFTMPRLKTINLHPSLLPKLRGAAPIEWALINGERESGVTVQLINEELDAGDIILQERIAIPESMTAGEMYDAVLPIGARLLTNAIEQLHGGSARPVQQNGAEATYCGKLDRDTARIRWDNEPFQIHNLVRGLNPRPGAWCVFRGKQVKIWKTAPFAGEISTAPAPGRLLPFQKKRLIAGTGGGPLEILAIQPENKKVMDGLSFINGYRLSPNDYLE